LNNLKLSPNSRRMPPRVTNVKSANIKRKKKAVQNRQATMEPSA